MYGLPHKTQVCSHAMLKTMTFRVKQWCLFARCRDHQFCPKVDSRCRTLVSNTTVSCEITLGHSQHASNGISGDLDPFDRAVCPLLDHPAEFEASDALEDLADGQAAPARQQFDRCRTGSEGVPNYGLDAAGGRRFVLPGSAKAVKHQRVVDRVDDLGPVAKQQIG